jgi:large subunit ribosomal protein L10
MKRVGQIFRESLVSRIKNGVEKNNTIFMLTYTNLSATKVSDIRKNLKKNGAEIFLSKNAIAAMALKLLGHEKLAERIMGQTIFVWGPLDSAEISKILIKYEKDMETLKVRGGLFDGKLFSAEDIKRLSELPPRQVLLSQVASTLQAPLNRLAGALIGKHRDLLSILKQLSEKKGGK